MHAFFTQVLIQTRWLLVVQKDLQNLPGDVNELSEILKVPVETHVINDLIHILRLDPNEPSTQHYSDLTEERVDAELIYITVQWLSSQHIDEWSN